MLESFHEFLVLNIDSVNSVFLYLELGKWLVPARPLAK